MLKPDYTKSTVNLMSSIGKKLGWRSPYSSLKELDAELKDAEEIILIVVDGLSYKFLKECGQKSFLRKHVKNKISAAFPTTTAAANTVFHTGLPPQQTAITGWYMYFKEGDIIGAPLPFVSRVGESPLSEIGLSGKDLFNFKSFFERIKVKSYAILYEKIIGSEFNKTANKKANEISYKTVKQFSKKIVNISKLKGKKYIFAYFPKVDTSMHKIGVTSRKTKKVFRKIDRAIKRISKKLKGKNVKIIVTADHGLVDINSENFINITNYPKLVNLLKMPLSGDPRVSYFFIKKGKKKEFEKQAKKVFGKKCDILTRSEAIKKNYFGLFKENPKLKDRVGDYIIIPKKKYAVFDFIKNNTFIGYHGGLSSEELYVPLIVIDCKTI